MRTMMGGSWFKGRIDTTNLVSSVSLPSHESVQSSLPVAAGQSWIVESSLTWSIGSAPVSAKEAKRKGEDRGGVGRAAEESLRLRLWTEVGSARAALGLRLVLLRLAGKSGRRIIERMDTRERAREREREPPTKLKGNSRFSEREQQRRRRRRRLAGSLHTPRLPSIIPYPAFQ